MPLKSRAATGAGLLVSLALVVGVPTGWALTRSPDGVGALPQTTMSSPGASESTAHSVASSVRSPRVRRAVTPRPIQFSAPRIGVTEPIDPVGVDGAGAVAIPSDARRVGWYRFGSAPGDSIGSAVLVGHRDSRTQGRGALYPLADLAVGDLIVVGRSDGSNVRFRVVERRLYLKVGLPYETFFARTGTPRLTVITCGGPYDRQHGGYQDNLVVTAVRDRGAP